MAAGIRKLDPQPTPLTERISETQPAPPAIPTGPSPATIARKIADRHMSLGSLYEQFADALERRDEPEPVIVNENGLLSRKAAADYLGIHPVQLDRLVRNGHLKPVVPRGMVERRYERADLERYIAESKRQSR